MSTGESPERVPLEQVAQRGMELAMVNDYGSEFQGILDMTGAGELPGPASAEGLALKALYHQHIGLRAESFIHHYHLVIEPARFREHSAIREIADLYNGVRGEVRPQATPVLIQGLALLLQRATRSVEYGLVADALEATAQRLRDSG